MDASIWQEWKSPLGKCGFMLGEIMYSETQLPEDEGTLSYKNKHKTKYITT